MYIYYKIIYYLDFLVLCFLFNVNQYIIPEMINIDNGITTYSHHKLIPLIVKVTVLVESEYLGFTLLVAVK